MKFAFFYVTRFWAGAECQKNVRCNVNVNVLLTCLESEMWQADMPISQVSLLGGRIEEKRTFRTVANVPIFRTLSSTLQEILLAFQ